MSKELIERSEARTRESDAWWTERFSDINAAHSDDASEGDCTSEELKQMEARALAAEAALSRIYASLEKLRIATQKSFAKCASDYYMGWSRAAATAEKNAHEAAAQGAQDAD